jgi:hypothetical protein
MEKIAALQMIGLPIAIICVAITIGWVKNGYPLDGSWGQAVYPRKDEQAIERIRLLSQENAQLRAELGSIKDRLANVERIVTDSSHLLDREIEQLRGKTN